MYYYYSFLKSNKDISREFYIKCFDLSVSEFQQIISNFCHLEDLKFSNLSKDLSKVMNISNNSISTLRFVCFQHWKITLSSSLKNIIKTISKSKIGSSLRKLGIPNSSLTKFNVELMIRKYNFYDVTVYHYLDGSSML